MRATSSASESMSCILRSTSHSGKGGVFSACGQPQVYTLVLVHPVKQAALPGLCTAVRKEGAGAGELLIRRSSKAVFKNKWVLTKTEKVGLSAARLVSRTTCPGM